MTTVSALDAAWTDYADRIKAAGQSIAGPDFTDDPRLRAEGYRYVNRLVNLAHQIHLEFGDPANPTLFRYEDDVTTFGAPNTDNNYSRAAVDPAFVYRVTGDLSGVKELLISVHEGEMALGKPAVLAELTLGDLDVGADGWLELTVGGPEQQRNWLPLPAEATWINVRQFVADWEHDPIAVLSIQRIAGQPTSSTAKPEMIATALGRAAAFVEGSVAFWNACAQGITAMAPVNAFPPPMRLQGGAENMVHGAAQWSIGPDEALVVEFEQPQATYWSIQTYMLPWLIPLEFASRVTSLNNGQVHVDADGKVRVVMSHRDPGVQNWLDLSGLTNGLCTYRWVRSTTEPIPDADLINIDDVRMHLPDATPDFSVADRDTQIQTRRRGIARRFRR